MLWPPNRSSPFRCEMKCASLQPYTNDVRTRRLVLKITSSWHPSWCAVISGESPFPRLLLELSLALGPLASGALHVLTAVRSSTVVVSWIMKCWTTARHCARSEGTRCRWFQSWAVVQTWPLASGALHALTAVRSSTVLTMKKVQRRCALIKTSSCSVCKAKGEECIDYIPKHC